MNDIKLTRKTDGAINLTPQTAGASSRAVCIAQMILMLDGMQPSLLAIVRSKNTTGYDSRAFCADIARQVDIVLRAE